MTLLPSCTDVEGLEWLQSALHSGTQLCLQPIAQCFGGTVHLCMGCSPVPCNVAHNAQKGCMPPVPPYHFLWEVWLPDPASAAC
jgi:hypothetical protein